MRLQLPVGYVRYVYHHHFSQHSANPAPNPTTAGGPAQPALTSCCLQLLWLWAGWCFWGPCSSFHTTAVPLAPLCSGQAVGQLQPAESRRQPLFSAPKLAVGTRDAELQSAAKHGQLSSSTGMSSAISNVSITWCLWFKQMLGCRAALNFLQILH